MKSPDQVVADVTTRLRRNWSHAVAGEVLPRTGHGSDHVAGGSDRLWWPYSFPLGAPGLEELYQQFAA